MIIAGYSALTAQKNASTMLKANPAIRQRCEEILAARNAIEDRLAAHIAERKGYDKQFVRLGLQDVYARCMQADPATDRKGVPTGMYEFDAANALRALEDMGKDLSMFVDRKEIGPPGAFASIEERKEAEHRVKSKMVRLGLARVVGAGSMVGKAPGDAALESGVEIPTVNATEVQQVSESRQSEGGVEISTPLVNEVEPELAEAAIEPEPAAEDDPAPLPPGILEPVAGEPDPTSVERLKPAPGVAVCAIPGWGRRPPDPPKPKVPLQPLVDPGPGPDRAAYRAELRRRENLDVRYGTPNTRDRNGHPLK
jgi:hypothetical protein